MCATEKNKERSTLYAYAAYASPELKTCEHRLRCIVEGIENDQLLVRFSHVDKTDFEKEFSFVLDVSSRAYRGAWFLLCPPLILDLIFLDWLD
jgi:kinetochore protein Spc25, fungi type